VSKIDATTDIVINGPAVYNGPSGLAFDCTNSWVANDTDPGTVNKLRP